MYELVLWGPAAEAGPAVVSADQTRLAGLPPECIDPMCPGGGPKAAKANFRLYSYSGGGPGAILYSYVFEYIQNIFWRIVFMASTNPVYWPLLPWLVFEKSVSVYKPVFKWSGRNARFIIISGTPGCLREGKFSAECEAGLAALNDIDDADEAGGLTGSFASKILDLCCDGVEIALPSFRDLLADKPVDSANAIQSLSEWSAGVAVDGEKVKKGGKTAGKTA
ncbi:hypothetical protein B0H11DRAFT_1907877 [Mycena galericulata]|nr:hypothetical protein B0H11DRAFT_1907877 [Mycena galericulata]